MRDFLERHSGNAVLAALIASSLAFVSSLGSIYLSYHYNVEAQDRQVKLEQISKFDASNADLVVAAGAFISAINDNKDLESARKQLSAVLANQLYSTDNIKIFYDGRISTLIKDYQRAITELNQVAQKTSSVTEMRPWAESFGRVLDTKATLSQQLYSELGTTRS